MNNLYLFDIDGTLSINGIIPESAKKAIRELRKKNNIVLLATGRCLGQMESILNEIEIDGAILNNGALLMINKETLFESPIAKEEILKMNELGYAVGLLARDSYLRISNDPIFAEFIKHFSIKMPELVKLDYLDKHKIYSLGIYNQDLTKINCDLFPSLRFVAVCDIGYDVINKNINKSSCFDCLRKTYPKAKIIAFGDNYNDLEMLIAADISIAMPQAPKAVKEVASYVTRSIFEDGIEYALKNYLKVI